MAEGSSSKIDPEVWDRARSAFGQPDRDGLRYPGRDPRVPNPSTFGEVTVPADPGREPGDGHKHCDCGCGARVVLIGEDGRVREKGRDDRYDCRERSWWSKGEGEGDG